MGNSFDEITRDKGTSNHKGQAVLKWLIKSHCFLPYAMKLPPPCFKAGLFSTGLNTSPLLSPHSHDEPPQELEDVMCVDWQRSQMRISRGFGIQPTAPRGKGEGVRHLPAFALFLLKELGRTWRV